MGRSCETYQLLASVPSAKYSQADMMTWNFMVRGACLVVAVLASAVSGGYLTKSSAPAAAKNCHIEYETVTTYEQQCSTSYERDCNTVQLQECTPRVEKISSPRILRNAVLVMKNYVPPSNRE